MGPGEYSARLMGLILAAFATAALGAAGLLGLGEALAGRNPLPAFGLTLVGAGLVFLFALLLWGPPSALVFMLAFRALRPWPRLRAPLAGLAMALAGFALLAAAPALALTPAVAVRFWCCA